MGINDFNKTPEVSTSVESKNSIITSVKLALAGLLLSINTNNAIAQNTTPDTNKVLAQTELEATDPMTVETILAKHNITDIANCKDSVALSTALQEIEEILKTIPLENKEERKPYLYIRRDIKNRLDILPSEIKLATATKEAEEATNEANQAEEALESLGIKKE